MRLTWDLKKFTDSEITALSNQVRKWADRIFGAYPPTRQGRILDWCQEIIDLRDEIDREILWRTMTWLDARAAAREGNK